jgi:hypothetical protein
LAFFLGILIVADGFDGIIKTFAPPPLLQG